MTNIMFARYEAEPRINWLSYKKFQLGFFGVIKQSQIKSNPRDLRFSLTKLFGLLINIHTYDVKWDSSPNVTLI